jgi:hypothetical protein
VKSPRETAGALAEAGAFLSAPERAELEREPFYVVDVRSRFDSGGDYGPSCLFVVAVPGLFGSERRLLALGWNKQRARFAGELEQELRSADAVGPFVLERRPTESGHEAWRFVAAPSPDEGTAAA